MSDSQTLPEQRTEMPTGRRMGELRKKGQLFISHECAQLLSYCTGFVLLFYIWRGFYEDLTVIMQKSYEAIGSARGTLEVADLHAGFLKLVVMLAPDMLLLSAVVAAVAVLAVMLQSNWNVKEKWIEWKWNLLNPKGILRIFSPQGYVNVGKAILKLCIFIPVGYFALKGLAPRMVLLIHSSIPDIMALTTQAIWDVFWQMTYILIPFAIFDFVWGKWMWLRNMKMTKNEVKDEHKSVEGDEGTKRNIQRKGFNRIMTRLQMSVPKATVVVTNPTHYAVALQYDRDKHSAPIVVAKGGDFIAMRIREIAKEHNIPILERKALARALYAATPVGKEVPRELFRAVAEVLAYVFKVKGRAPSKSAVR